MESRIFNEVVRVAKNTSCKTCETYSYKFPFILTKPVFIYLAPLGQQRYPPERSNLIRIDNEFVGVRGYVGRTEIMVKFKSDVVAQKAIVDNLLAAYTESELKVPIILEKE